MMKKIIFLSVLVFLNCITVMSQNTNVSGTVKDAQGEPLVGVVVKTADGANLGVTDVDGRFNINTSVTADALKFCMLGYTSVTQSVSNNMNVVLKNDVHNLDGDIELGFSKSSKNDYSGSAAVLYGKQMMHAPVSDFANTFSGNLPGLLTRENSTEPGRQNFIYNVRGISSTHANQPLVVLDGVICYPGTQDYSLAYISPNEIEQVSVLKDAASQALYGAEGAEGVIIITTKHGVKGQTVVNCFADVSLMQPTTKPRFINSWEYAEMRNQAAYNDGLGKNYYFSDQAIQNYKSGSDPLLYPNTNWYKMNMRTFVPMERVGVSMSGGNDWVSFFSNVNVLHDDGQLKTEAGDGKKTNDYHRNLSEFWVNYRANLDFNFADWIRASLNIAGNMKKEHTPGAAYFLGAIYPHFFSMPSTVYGPLTPTIDGAGYPGNEIIVTQKENESPYGMINRTGYTNYTVNNIYAKFGVTLDLGNLINVKGLSLGGDVAYRSYSNSGLFTTKSYRRYQQDISSETLSFLRKGTVDNSSLAYGKSADEFYDLFYKGNIDYKFNYLDHHVEATGFGWYQHYSASGTPMPYEHALFGAELAYNYAHKYILRLDYATSGSEEFARSDRWVKTPAVSAAWVISKENFMKTLPFVSNAKVRVSLGKTANDRLGLPRYPFEDVISPSGSITESSYGNPHIHAETFKKLNVGVDLGFLDMIDFSFDIFKEKCNDVVCLNTIDIPTFQGIPLGTFPHTNSGEIKNHGFETSLAISKQFKDFEFSIGGNLAYAKDKIINIGETPLGDGYVCQYRWTGYNYGRAFGYKVDYSNGNGMYNFQSELDKAPTYSFGTPRLGDLKYQDLNNDGKIDAKDQVPITRGAIPQITYGINGFVRYKNFDLTVLFDGIGKYDRVIGGAGVWETDYDGIFGTLNLNSWTQERWNHNEKITYPALSTKASVNHQASDYFVYDCSFFRLRTLEVGYNLPTSLVKRIGFQSVRVVLNGQNLITWDHMKSDDFGPEGSYLGIPIYRVYNFGLKVSF
jgi:TonB-linked SusC/RagA family outer membrane protein